MARRIKPEVRHHPYMTLAAANFFLPYAKERGVSKVARGESKSTVTSEGFMQAYARVKGDPKKEGAARLLSIAFASINRRFAVSPTVPAERVALLRRAFADTMKDTQFIAEAERMHADLSPTTGEQLEALVSEALSFPPDIVEILKEALREPKP